jgi:hypothetical protein
MATKSRGLAVTIPASARDLPERDERPGLRDGDSAARDVKHGLLPLCVSAGQSKAGRNRMVAGIKVSRRPSQPVLRRARGCTRSVSVRVDSVSSHLWDTRGVASGAGPWTAFAQERSAGQKDGGGGPLGRTTTWRSWISWQASSPTPRRLSITTDRGALYESTRRSGTCKRRRAVHTTNAAQRVAGAFTDLPRPEVVRHACALARRAADTLGFLMCSPTGWSDDRDVNTKEAPPGRDRRLFLLLTADSASRPDDGQSSGRSDPSRVPSRRQAAGFQHRHQCPFTCPGVCMKFGGRR